MPEFNPLRVILLATLQSKSTESVSRYSVMIEINHIFGTMDSPYSPGAVYHETKKLLSERLIKFDQKDMQITSLGVQWLYTQLSSAALPSSILGKVYYLIAADLVKEAEIQTRALRRIEIEMIKNNHNRPSNEHTPSLTNRALTTCLIHLSAALRKSVIDLSAQ